MWCGGKENFYSYNFMPIQRKWNKFALAALIILIGQWVIIGPLIKSFIGQNGLSSLASVPLIYIFAVPAILPLFSLLLALIALWRIDSVRETGKGVAWLVIVITTIGILAYWSGMWFFTSITLANSNNGMSFGEVLVADPQQDPDASRKTAHNAAKYSDMLAIKNVLQSFHASNQKYPSHLAEVRSAWNNPPDFASYNYLQLNGGQSYVLRTQLETDYQKLLNSSADRDGMQGSLDCDDASF